jgi:hypothetical protein
MTFGFAPVLQDVFSDRLTAVFLNGGMERVEEIEYVVAYHSGGFVNGIVVRLLKSEEDVEALVALLIEARAHLAKTDGPISAIVSGWQRRKSGQAEPFDALYSESEWTDTVSARYAAGVGAMTEGEMALARGALLVSRARG